MDADVHPDVVPVAWLLGTWRGEGVGGYPTIEDFRYGQEVRFSHDGRAVLAYASRSWLLDDVGAVLRPAATETGYWRPQPDGTIEVVLAHPTGFAEIWIGTVTGTRIEVHTDVVARTGTAKEVNAGHRLYGLVGADLLYAYDMAAVGHALQPHLSARLAKVGAEG
ncbi:MAG TPA: FABP family protein [Mycobacteriales bacterium]|nr:FABP family protein [Mycobacteriales bacterium]